MEFPRHVHRAVGPSRIVRSASDCAEAVAEGWSLEPVLTEEQVAAVRSARIAAGELVEDLEVAPVEVTPAIEVAPVWKPEPRRSGRR